MDRTMILRQLFNAIKAGMGTDDVVKMMNMSTRMEFYKFLEANFYYKHCKNLKEGLDRNDEILKRKESDPEIEKKVYVEEINKVSKDEPASINRCNANVVELKEHSEKLSCNIAELEANIKNKYQEITALSEEVNEYYLKLADCMKLVTSIKEKVKVVDETISTKKSEIEEYQACKMQLKANKEALDKKIENYSIVKIRVYSYKKLEIENFNVDFLNEEATKKFVSNIYVDVAKTLLNEKINLHILEIEILCKIAYIDKYAQANEMSLDLEFFDEAKVLKEVYEKYFK